MQRLEFRLIFFPDLHEWRLYNGEDYRSVKPDMSDIYNVVGDTLDDVSRLVRVMSDNVRLSNPRILAPREK